MAVLTVAMGLAQAGGMAPYLSQLTSEQRAEYEAKYAHIRAVLPYELITVSAEHALSEWQRLKDLGEGSPVVVGDDTDLERIAEHFSMGDPAAGGVSFPGIIVRSPDQIIKEAESLIFPKDMYNWSGIYKHEDSSSVDDEWPDERYVGSPELSVASHILSGDLCERVHILVLPTKNGWEAPAYLRWGNWNACPPAEYHVAALRDWHDRFGADLVGISGDVMNIKVQRCPENRGQALALARDMYDYCPDIVDQGMGTVTALAAQLMKLTWWYFWWD